MTDEVIVNYGAEIEVKMRHNNKVEIDLATQNFLAVENTTAFFKPSVGRLITNSINGTSLTFAATSVANTDVLFPYSIGCDGILDQMNINVTTAIASAQAKLGLYRSDSSGRPSDLIVESQNIVDCSVAGSKFPMIGANVAVAKGEIIWGSIRYSHAGVIISGPQLYNSISIDHGISITAIPTKFIRQSVLFTSDAPASWLFSDADLVAAVPPIMGLRIAG